MSIRTLKIPIHIDSELNKNEIYSYILNYNSVLRFTYNRLKDAHFRLSTKEVTALQKCMNNVFLDAHFLNCAQQDARQLKDKDKVIFGGRYNYIQRCKGKISKEDFKRKRLCPLHSIGMAAEHGNRKFRILSTSEILFQPDRYHKFVIKLPKLRKNLVHAISTLKIFQDSNRLAISYKLCIDAICIIFDDQALYSQQTQRIKDRVLALDLNPNYVGWSIVDWKDSQTYLVIDAGVISNKQINDAEYQIHVSSSSPERLYLSNKRTFENTDTVKYLANLAKHYQCEIVSLEKLEIVTKDNKQGKKFNRLVNNQWNRQIFYNQIEKYCDRYNIKFYKVVANYSSFEGNLVYRKTGLPDMCLSSIELGRRAYEFHHQYVLQDKPKEKNIMFDASKTAEVEIVQSLEELNYFDEFKDIKSLYKEIKTRNLKYRVLLEESILTAVSSKKSIKSKVLLYST